MAAFLQSEAPIPLNSLGLTDFPFPDLNPDSGHGPSHASRARKKPRLGKKDKKVIQEPERGKGNAGLDKIPLDILYEVLLLLRPEDLMRLSRMNKTLRSALTSISTRFIWRKAIEAASMPHCPPDLNEMEYVKFVFDTFCDYCNRDHGKEFYPIYLTRKRVCKECSSKRFKDATRDPLRDVLPYALVPPEAGRFYFWPHGKAYRVSKDEHKAVTIEWYSKITTKKRNAWYSEKRQKAVEHEQLRPLLEDWFESERVRIKEEEMSLRQARYNAIMTKLREEGWREEVHWMRENPLPETMELRGLESVSLAEALTDHAWSMMRAEVLEIMGRARTILQPTLRTVKFKTRLPLLKASLTKWTKRHPYDHFGPNFADLAVQEEVSALLRAPIDLNVTEDDFDTLLEDNYGRFSASWRSQAEQHLLELIKAEVPWANRDLLTDLMTVFFCKGCGTYVQYPWMLKHKCKHICAFFNESNKDLLEYDTSLGCIPWHSSNFLYEAEISRRALEALSCFETLPSRNLMALELFECLQCSQTSQRRVFMTWNEAISGTRSCVVAGHSLRQANLSSEEEKLKRFYIDLVLSNAENDYGFSDYFSPIECVMCAGSTIGEYPSKTFTKHQEIVHNKVSELWREGIDFYRRPSVVTSLEFKKYFILTEDPDIRDILYRVPVPSLSPLRRSDLRSDPAFAEGNYLLTPT